MNRRDFLKVLRDAVVVVPTLTLAGQPEAPAAEGVAPGELIAIGTVDPSVLLTGTAFPGWLNGRWVK